MGEIFISVDDVSNTLGALVAQTLSTVASKIDGNREHGVFLMKSEITIHFQGKTSNEGPLWVGVSCNLTGAEVQEMLLNDPQNGQGSNMEVATRGYFKLLAVIPREGTTSPTSAGLIMPIVIKPGWTLPEGSGFFQFWVFNASGSNLTTGTIVDFGAVNVQRWLKD